MAFSWRSHIPWGRRYSESGQGVASFLSTYWKELAARYGLDRLGHKLDAHSFSLNLAKLEQLELLANAANLSLPQRPVRLLDIGSQHFVYAPALSLFFSHWATLRPRTVELTGIEVDPYRRRWTLHTRRDLARYYASLLPWIVYQPGDFLATNFPQRFDAIAWFRPHMAEEPLLAAGLPARFHQPEQQMRRAFDLLELGGTLFLSYQSQTEAEIAEELLQKLGAQPTALQRWDPPREAIEKKPQWLQAIRKV